MEDFDPGADRAKQARDAATLARLRAAAPGAVDRMASAVQEPDSAAVHREIIRKRFPFVQNIAKGWPRGLPDLRALADLATLAAHFSPGAILRRRRVEQHFRTYFRATSAEQRRMEIATLGHPRRRSPWSRLAFWR